VTNHDFIGNGRGGSPNPFTVRYEKELFIYFWMSTWSDVFLITFLACTLQIKHAVVIALETSENLELAGRRTEAKISVEGGRVKNHIPSIERRGKSARVSISK